MSTALALSVGDLHFRKAMAKSPSAAPSRMAGWVHMRVSLIKGGMAKYGIRNPIFKPSPITPNYNDYLIFEGISVDEAGQQHYLDVHVAYRQACLNAIEYMTRFGYSRAQAYADPGHGAGAGAYQRRRVDVTQLPGATLWLPTQIFDFDIRPEANGPTVHIKGGADVLLSPRPGLT
ncbi:acetamidase/formamidase family protein [Cupriavidus basilensis]